MPFVEEFLFRGRADGSGDYHVVLGNLLDDGFGGRRLLLSDPMTPTDAEGAGFPLKAIFGEINEASLAQVAAVQAELQAVKTATTALVAELDGERARRQRAENDLAAERAKDR